MKLHEYQEYAKDFIVKNPYCGLLLDMGLGKTLTTLEALDEMMLFDEVQKILVIAPLKVAKETWSAEIEKWESLRHLKVSKVLGSKQQRLKALQVEADIYTINVENVSWLVDLYKTKWPFETVVVDEFSCFKNSKAKRWRALRQVRPKIKRLIGLTGTPAPRGLPDLWSQMYLIDRGERLTPTKTRYLSTYFHPGASSGYVVYDWKLKDGAENIIFEKISDVCISMKAKDYLKLPERTNNYIEVDIPLEAYEKMKREYVLTEDITASSAGVLANKLQQIAQGAIYTDDKKTEWIHDEKLDALERIVEESQGQPILVFYQYKHDLERLKVKFPQAEEFTSVERWNSGQVPILLVHPQSAGHGLNLQHGGHTIVWFSLTWGLEFYMQANARLDRQGQTEPVIVHHIIAKGTIDEKIIKTLSGKEKVQNAVFEAVKAELAEVIH